MNFDALTDAELDQLRTMSKVVTNARIQWKVTPGHRQKNYLLENDRYQFELYLRQNTNDEGDFSCGLKPESHADLTTRYMTLNGALHCLVNDCSISGLRDLQPDEPDMFGE